MTAKRVDQNQAMIVEALRRAGASVPGSERVWQGLPDLLIGVSASREGNECFDRN